MKTSIRVVLGMAILFASVQYGFSQVRFSPKVGVNASALDVKLEDINAEAEARAGWNAGLDLRLGDGAFFLAPGLHYYSFTTRIVNDLSNPSDLDFSKENTIQSLRAPINLGLRLTGDNGLLGIYAKGGITPAYVLNVTQKDEVSIPESPSVYLDDLNRFTWGANVGAGIDLLFLTAELNYEIGLNDFFKNAEGKNNVLTFSVGLKF